MQARDVFHGARDASKENSDAGRARVRQSSSLLSLRSLVTAKRASAAAPMLVISQPTLAEASREKMRNKIRQSPSMLSIHARGAEPASKYEKETFDELLGHASGRAPERDFCRRPDRLYEEYTIGRTPAAELLQTLRIYAQLANDNSFARVLDVHLLPTGADSESQYRCLFELSCYGTRLTDFAFEAKSEPVQILMSLAEALARAEESIEFEHRNLHPGNIMVERDYSTGTIAKVTILNCALARTHGPGAPVICTPLEHPAFYEARTPVLALMRKVVKDPAAYTPVTNVMWLTYLARYMYNIKPSSKLKALYDVLNPKWPLKRSMRSTRDALIRMRAKT